MEKYLKQGVKPIIDQFPEVGRILDEFDIGCTSCSVGTCLLQDVVTIHHLEPAVEAELMYQIEKTIYPDRDGKKPEIKASSKNTPRVIKYSPPVQQLVDEHKVIKRWLALVPQVIDLVDNDPDQAWDWIKRGAEFSRFYADRLHHAKEEDILFSYADKDSEIIQVMYDDHVTGRNHISAVFEATETRDKAKAAENLLAYRELLQQHIKKEDEILFPWIDRSLTDRQVGELFTKFSGVTGEAEKHEQFVAEVEGKLGK